MNIAVSITIDIIHKTGLDMSALVVYSLFVLVTHMRVYKDVETFVGLYCGFQKLILW